MAEERTPPHDLECEAAVVSAAIMDPMALDKAAAILTPDKFYSSAHGWIFSAVLALRADGKAVDAVQVATWLRDNDRLTQVGGMSGLTEILNAAPALANVEAYATTVANKWQIRQMILRCQRIVAQGYAPVSDPVAFIDSAEQAVYEVGRAAASRPKLHPMRDVVRARFQAWGDYWKKVERGEIRPGEVSGLSTGLDALDNMTGGLQDGNLIIVAARPGMGKTSLVYGIAEHVATTQPPRRSEGSVDYPFGAAFFSLEMPEEEMADRAICGRAGVDLRKTRTAMFDRSDWTKLTTACVELSKLGGLLIDDSPGLTVTQVRAMAREAASEMARLKRRLRLVAVDYLQLISPDMDERSREQEVAKVSRALKSLAKELELPVIALAQLNRGVETRADKRPLMSDLRESGAIEQDADLIVFVYRDEYYKADTVDKNVAELIIGKQRSGGPTGTIRVRFDGHLTRFSNLPESDDPFAH